MITLTSTVLRRVIVDKTNLPVRDLTEPCESSDVFISHIASFQRYYNLVAKPYISNKINYVLVFRIFKQINNTIINLQANATSCQISYRLNVLKSD